MLDKTLIFVQFPVTINIFVKYQFNTKVDSYFLLWIAIDLYLKLFIPGKLYVLYKYVLKYIYINI